MRCLDKDIKIIKLTVLPRPKNVVCYIFLHDNVRVCIVGLGFRSLVWAGIEGQCEDSINVPE